MTISYLDAEGKELKSAPWAQTLDGLVPAEGESEHEVGTYVPMETRGMNVKVTLVFFGDGTHWNETRGQ